jgi:hypothetical protein
MIDAEKIRKELVVLRNITAELLDRLDGEIKKIEPSPVKPRQSKKAERELKYASYLATGKWKRQRKVTDKTFSK